MAFNVDFYVFEKDENSTKRPGTANVSFPCELIAETSIFNPRIVLQVAGNPVSYNYAFIREFDNRYYFVSNWTWYNGRWSASLIEDVLATWRDTIGGTTQYILRSSAAFDGSVVDLTYPCKAGFSVQTQVEDTPWDLNPLGGRYLVGLIGGSGLTEYWQMTPTQFSDFVGVMFSDRFYGLMTEDLTIADYKLSRSFINPSQYLSSVTWFPMAFGAGPGEKITLGWWEVPFTARRVTDPYGFKKTYTLPSHPQAGSRGSYLNYTPYSTYTLDIKPWGTINIDPNKMGSERTIELDISVDPFTGIGLANVSAGTERIATSTAQVGVPVQLSQITNNLLGKTGSFANAVGSGIQGALAGAGIGGPVGVVVGAGVGVLSNVGSMLSAMTPETTTNGINGGRASLYGDWQFIARHAILVDEDLDHRGRPLCQLRRVGSLNGFILIDDPKISFAAMDEETTKIKQYMTGGFFFE